MSDDPKIVDLGKLRRGNNEPSAVQRDLDALALSKLSSRQERLSPQDFAGKLGDVLAPKPASSNVTPFGKRAPK